MTLKAIKSMFAPGQRWQCQRTGKAVTIVGNLGNTTLPANNVDEVRIVKRVGSTDLVTTKPDGRDVYATWPKAGEVIEARPGFLHFAYDNNVHITLSLLP